MVARPWQSWMTSPNKGSRYDPWYVKVAFGLFLFVLVGVLVALYVAAVPYRGAIVAETSKHNAAGQPPFRRRKRGRVRAYD